MVNTLVAQSSDGVGSVTKVEGEVTIKRADGEMATAELGTTIFQGDTVLTSANGGVNISFVDETHLALDADAEMVIDEMVFDPNADSSMVLNIVTGTFAFVSGELAGLDDGMTLKTPFATIGIRGTAGAGNMSQVVLLEEANKVIGEIFYQTKAGTAVLSEGNYATGAASANDVPTPPFHMTPEEIYELFGNALIHLPQGSISAELVAELLILSESLSEAQLQALEDELASELENTETAAGGQDTGGTGAGKSVV